MSASGSRDIRMIAVDIGASSGRIMLGVYDGQSLCLREEARFTHPLIQDPKYGLVWDFPGIWEQVSQGIRAICKREERVDSIGVESFAGDFCVFDKQGRLSAPMHSYRGYLSDRYLEAVTDKVRLDDFWEITGNLPVCFSILCQLVDQQKSNPALSESGSIVLPLSNAINYLMCGRKCTDHTISSASTLNDWRTKGWHKGLCETFLNNPAVLPDIVPCATVLGEYRIQETEYAPKVINVGMHDTAIANYMIGILAEGQLCINAGTWISVGVITEEPVLTEEARKLEVFGCGLPDERNLLCRIMMGTWYLQQLRKFWQSQGKAYSFEEMAEMARCAEEQSFPIDVWEGDYFTSDADLPELIRKWVGNRFGVEIRTKAGIIRCAYDGIACGIKDMIQKIERITGKQYERIYLGGGAVQDRYFCERLESDCGKKVVRMPAESTAVGNLLIQLRALGEIREEKEAKQLLENIRVQP